MNIDDLRVILGTDQRYRRNFTIATSGNQIILSFEINNNNIWETSSETFIDSIAYAKIAYYNIRKCLFFTAYRKSKETSQAVKIYSGQVV